MSTTHRSSAEPEVLRCSHCGARVLQGWNYCPACRWSLSVSRETVRAHGGRGAGVGGTNARSRGNWAAIVTLGLITFLVSYAGARRWLGPTRDAAPPPAAATPATEGDAPRPPPAERAPPEGMVYILGGSFMMGRDGGDPLESPAHEVSVKPFYLDIYEVTCGQYRDFVEATGREVPPGWGARHCPEANDELPATGVSWEDAEAYAAWVGKRLPTEAEWEFAARGPQSFDLPWGAEWKSGAANAGPDGKGRVVNVGSHPSGASPFGVHDMVGNAWEWTASRFQPYAKGDAAPPGERLMVLRGGCFLNSSAITAAFRRGWPAVGADYTQTGFRCAKDAAR